MRILLAPSAAKNFPRFCRTRSRESQSVNPRFRTFSVGLCVLAFAPSRFVINSLAPPGRVLKPWVSQVKRASDGDSSIRKPLRRCNIHCAERCRVFALILCGEAFFFARRVGIFDCSNLTPSRGAQSLYRYTEWGCGAGFAFSRTIRKRGAT